MNLPKRLLLPAILVGVAVSGCSGFGGPIQGEELSPEERRLRNIESKLETNEKRLDNLTEMQMSGDGPMALSEELRKLRGEVEQLRHDMEQAQERDRKLYQDLDRRLVMLEGGTPSTLRRPDTVTGSDEVLRLPGAGATSSGDGGGSGDGDASGPAPTSSRAQPDPKEDAAYSEAFDLLKQGKYADAVLGFENVVRNWPNGRHADTALYWAGESYYVQGEFSKALEKFNTLLDEHPRSSRVPDALLKAGFAYEEIGQTDKARTALQRILSEHPQSSVASLAQQRLARLR